MHAIASGLLQVQHKNFYGIVADVSHTGHYYHPYYTTIEFSCTRYGCDWSVSDEIEKEVSELLRDFMKWIYRSLEREHDYLLSDKAVDESIVANEYEFTKSGAREG